MKIIYDNRGSGKTTKLIQMSHDNWIYILVADGERAKNLAMLAKELNIDIPYPVTLAEYMRYGFEGSRIRKILIDDADDVWRAIFSRIEVEAITLTKMENE